MIAAGQRHADAMGSVVVRGLAPGDDYEVSAAGSTMAGLTVGSVTSL